MLTLSLILALPLGLSHPAPGLSPEPLALPPMASAAQDIKSIVDRSLRWLRHQQDQESGSYGDVHATLEVLGAMAYSPRAYRPTDGPYFGKALEYALAQQAADGSFGNAGASAEQRLLDTRRALQLLETLGGPKAASERALAFVAEQGRGPKDAFGPELPKSEQPGRLRELAQARVRALEEARGTAAHWDGERGALLATTASIHELNALARLLASLPAPAGSGASEAESVVALPAYESSLEPAALARARKAMLRGADFLLAEAVAPGRWGFQGQADPGITAMAATALLELAAPRPEPVQEAIESSLKWLISLQREDGSIHQGQVPNYVTSASLMALSRDGRERHAAVIARARDFLVKLQADEGEGYRPSDRYYGGVGYGGDERPDLSNMNMALEALSDAGLEQGDTTFTKALSFLQRCQNRSETNPQSLTVDGTVYVSGNDGGAGYAPGESKAGFITLRDGRKIPRSYGSMTYALLKGYLFAGLAKDDGRVQAAWEWLSANYTLDINPGFEGSADPRAGYQGLFYYFTTMSKALDLYGEERVTDATGRQHEWRAELVGRMVSLQRQDGSWINTNAPRWYEGNPVLATSYALQTLGNTLPGK